MPPVRSGRRVVLGVLALLIVGAAPANADKCTRAKLKAIGKGESGLLACQAKIAVASDPNSVNPACENKVNGKFTTAFGKAGTCAGDQTQCENVAAACTSSVAGAFIDTFPSKCEAAKRKAAAKLTKAEFACYAKAAAKGVAVDSGCISKATGRFSTALTKAGTCTDGGSPQSTVEDNCVTPGVTTNGGMVSDVCPATSTTSTTSTSASTSTTTSSSTSSSTTTSTTSTTTSSTTTTTSSSTTTTTQCTVYADLQPGPCTQGCTLLPQYLTLDAEGSHDSCGAPLEYIWGCSSGTSVDCPSFEATYNNNGQYDQPVAHILINSLDVIDIALLVCTRDGARCAPEIVYEYIGAIQ